MRALLRGLLVLLAWLFGIAVVAFLGLYLIAKLGTVNTYYRCPGEMESAHPEGGAEKSTAFLRMQTYRIFMFWAHDAGMLWVETSPQGDFLLLQDMPINNDIMISFSDGENSADLSKNSLVLHMRLRGSRYFTGECAPANR